MEQFIYFYAPFLVVIISIIFCFWFVLQNDTFDE
ncbi:cytochrome bd oxidase small subunit CydS [Gracilibacillus xinjiangensis]|uniref:Cbb3-type cytochrome oxidase assembly protein CcoS n=1 Tax=Gracilibacillus xinjiangensis TaxID=1193282 RepID=A0ABV8WWG9_9BACI